MTEYERPSLLMLTQMVSGVGQLVRKSAVTNDPADAGRVPFALGFSTAVGLLQNRAWAAAGVDMADRGHLPDPSRN